MEIRVELSDEPQTNIVRCDNEFPSEIDEKDNTIIVMRISNVRTAEIIAAATAAKSKIVSFPMDGNAVEMICRISSLSIKNSEEKRKIPDIRRKTIQHLVLTRPSIFVDVPIETVKSVLEQTKYDNTDHIKIKVGIQVPCHAVMRKVENS
jgi:hypothetical protein